MNTGLVNCSTIAFAAVVSLFATVNSVAEPPSPIAAIIEFLRTLICFRYTASTAAAIRPLSPEIINGFQLISFIKIPAVLHKTAHTIISSIAFVLLFILTPPKTNTEYILQHFQYVFLTKRV